MRTAYQRKQIESSSNKGFKRVAPFWISEAARKLGTSNRDTHETNDENNFLEIFMAHSDLLVKSAFKGMKFHEKGT